MDIRFFINIQGLFVLLDLNLANVRLLVCIRYRKKFLTENTGAASTASCFSWIQAYNHRESYQ